MAPIRRYLRISKYSVLECRIYLENPADSRWLLDSRDPVLPRVFKSIQPLVLPKLREENERARAKKKSRPVKDVLVEDEFEVSLFLRETGTRHAVATRHRSFKGHENISSGLTGNSAIPINIPDDGEQPVRILEESAPLSLYDIPEAQPEAVEAPTPSHRRRRRRQVSSTGETEETSMPPTKRNKAETPAETVPQEEKKMSMTTSYEGFNIWGWILCLLVSRRDKSKPAKTGNESSNQALMEEWICTQAPQEYGEG
ncbi:conserved hypothetical protein [Uncinocarpus reesii 1704]|uniref:Uncharacterized protein n=1 Tax=Uncinocarpus reesii (strain UAMH 1704) TaxID=336963 RepID=C4JFM7_UNCRE|nr:uncharacterized protein UREG_02361 [Uncinocarpus reesii 1704]EEP77512.1 conserved hypothetical protein [Uncinocarpus reesii 1704]